MKNNQTLRIITGKYKSIRISAPAHLQVRPTTDMAKSGLFNILENYFSFENMKVLDLFCGTGNISYEFSSRGCMDIESVDSNRNCIQFISNQLKSLSFTGIKTFCLDSIRFLEKQAGEYDLIFADPPFEMKPLTKLLSIIFDNGKLKKNGWFIYEHSDRDDYSTLPFFVQKRIYGSVAFSMFKK